MTGEATVAISLAAALASVVLIGALVAWRFLGRAGRGLREAEERLTLRAQSLPRSGTEIRERLVLVRADSERALWTLSNLDARLEATQTALADKRAASDRLRASMERNQASLERVRNGARLLLRVIQLRREILG